MYPLEKELGGGVWNGKQEKGKKFLLLGLNFTLQAFESLLLPFCLKNEVH